MEQYIFKVMLNIQVRYRKKHVLILNPSGFKELVDFFQPIVPISYS